MGTAKRCDRFLYWCKYFRIYVRSRKFMLKNAVENDRILVVWNNKEKCANVSYYNNILDAIT